MSDLTATNCGCGCNDGRSGMWGGNNCWWIIILLLFFCNGCGGSTWGRSGSGCGCGDNNCWWIIILLLFFCCGNNDGCGCGCDSGFSRDGGCGC